VGPEAYLLLAGHYLTLGHPDRLLLCTNTFIYSITIVTASTHTSRYLPTTERVIAFGSPAGIVRGDRLACLNDPYPATTPRLA